VWRNINQRCNNPNSQSYKNYGGRGITLCDRWLGKEGYKNFCEDMGERPEGTTIERIDNNKGYQPDNCKWATRLEQANNTRMTKLLTYKGMTKSISEWARYVGKDRSTLAHRLNSGLSVKQVLGTYL
jgi:hypothetical protein